LNPFAFCEQNKTAKELFTLAAAPCLGPHRSEIARSF
jgi:hypothetical protein